MNNLTKISIIILFCCHAVFAFADSKAYAPTPAVKPAPTPTRVDSIPSSAHDNLSADPTALIHLCRDQKLGLQFICDPDWPIETDTNVLMLIIQENPSITLTLTKIEEGPSSLDELTPEILAEIGPYAKGFKTHRVWMNQYDTLMIEAKTINDPNQRVVDFYLLKNNTLYGVMFFFESFESLMESQHLFEQIITSLDFIDEDAES